MAKVIISIPLDDDTSVFVEVDQADEGEYLTPEDALAPISVQDRLSDIRTTVHDAIENIIRPTIETMLKIRETVRPPDAIELEFGLKLSGRAGLVFASSQMEGHIKVKASWSTSAPE